jgi:hypothetical protein
MPDMPDAVPFGGGQIPEVIVLFADNDAKQGGFAMAVAAHQPYTFLGVNLETDAVEDRPATV